MAALATSVRAGWKVGVGGCIILVQMRGGSSGCTNACAIDAQHPCDKGRIGVMYIIVFIYIYVYCECLDSSAPIKAVMQ